MKNVLKFLCMIICSLTILISQSAYGIGAAVTLDDYTEVDYNDLCSSSFGELTTVRNVSLGNSRASSDVYYRNYDYELLDGEHVFFTLYMRFSDNLVFTPNGTDAGVSGSSLYTCTYLNDIPDSVKEDLNSRMASTYPAVELISQPTTSYNCHSYAWYSQNVSSNSVWLNCPNVYYGTLDSSYKRVYNPRVGDIICYYDLSEDSESQNIHSGIIVGLSGETSNGVCGDANKFIVQSKWGMNGLYLHKGDECPYTSTYNGTADEVRYYRPRTNASYSLSASTSAQSLSRAVSGSGSVTSTYGMYELNITKAGRYTFTICSDKALDNRLYDVHMNQIQLTSLTSGTGTYTYDRYLSAGIYYLRTAYADTTSSGTINITLAAHSHNYDQWIYYSHAAHIESCFCGQWGTETSSHSVRLSEIVDHRANCLGCGYLLDLTSDIAQTTPNRIVQMSVNGSYILSNGIAVLVDEDVDAYLNGTLLFYDIDDLPETQ